MKTLTTSGSRGECEQRVRTGLGQRMMILTRSLQIKMGGGRRRGIRSRAVVVCAPDAAAVLRVFSASPLGTQTSMGPAAHQDCYCRCCLSSAWPVPAATKHRCFGRLQKHRSCLARITLSRRE
jgi:hypothetical protein